MSRNGLQVKRVDHIFDPKTHRWTYEDTKSEPQILRGGKMQDGSDVWQAFCFVIVRKVPPQGSPPGVEPTVSIAIKSPYLRTACKYVIGEIPTLSWTVEILELSTEILISFFPRFVTYQEELAGKTDRSDEEDKVLGSLQVLIEYLREDHQATIAQINNLRAHGEITYDLLYAILIPGVLLVTTDSSTGELCALKLKNRTKASGVYTLDCVGLDVLLDAQQDSTAAADSPMNPVPPRFGRVRHSFQLAHFEGVVKINALPIYPIQYHSNEASLRDSLLARARKWLSLKGVHHVHYQGAAVSAVSMPMGRMYVKYEVDSRIMIDRGAFKQYNANYKMPQVLPMPINDGTEQANMEIAVQGWFRDRSVRSVPKPIQQPDILYVSVDNQQVELLDDDLILASPVLYGFSLSDKMWLEFNVEKFRHIVWSNEPFTNLVLPGNRRDLLRSLVEAHNSNLDFDDFVQGKGQGLVINLFGPPGVGKTLSAEATSEHLQRPLYMIGGGDLGADASAVDNTLKRVFNIAASWRAIVLIDEADVFLEQRSMHDLARNAMVAVFLRHLEYYRGILFLTTNRVNAFDPAFLSRIHVALHFKELSSEAKLKIWQAFLQKVDVDNLTAGELDNLVSRAVNGRQIKNATRTAISLAKSRGQKLAYQHLAETLDAIEEFANDFAQNGN